MRRASSSRAATPPATRRRWRAGRVPAGLHYCGFSAGSAVAARRAIVGGWLRDGRPILDADFGEELGELEVRDGLGLVDFAVDVHAAQWGTLTRLIAAVDAGLVAEGYAIDEGTVLVSTAASRASRGSATPGGSGRTKATPSLACCTRCSQSPSRPPARCASRSARSPSCRPPDDAVVRIERTGVCGSDLHIYHGRVGVEPGFTIGHEYVGEVDRRGRRGHVGGGRRPRARLLPGRLRHLLLLPRRQLPQVRRRRARSATARRSARCRARRPSRRSCPTPTSTLRRVPEGMSDDVALFAGDVMGTGYHAALDAVRARRHRRRPRPRARRAVRRAGRARRGRRAGHRRSTPSPTASRWRAASAPSPSTSPRRTRAPRSRRPPAAAAPTSTIEAVGHPQALEMAIRLTAQVRRRQRRRRLRRALRGPHGPAVDQGADA